MIPETIDSIKPEKPYTLFISDLHLSAKTTGLNALFTQLTSSELAMQADEFYILGDLFDFWLGDELLDNPVYAVIANQLADIASKGIRCYFQIGNRDFLIDQRFYQETGFQPIDDPVCIDLYGTPTVLSHGDILCSMDMMYQMFRKFVRDPGKRKMFLSQPMERRIAEYKRFGSLIGLHKATKSAQIMDVDMKTVERQRSALGAEWIIHGHTHRPYVHTDQKRAVIPDWRETDDSVVGGLLIVTPDSHTIHLIQ